MWRTSAWRYVTEFINAFSIINEVLRSEDYVDKPSEAGPASNKPPTSMPVPAVPRRAAPPRRKKETPKPSDEAVAPPQEEETVVPEAKIPLPESTSNLVADAGGDNTEVPSDVGSKPAPTTGPSPLPVKDESPEPAQVSSLVTERSTSPRPVRPDDYDHDDIPEDAPAPAPPKEGQAIPSLSGERLAEVVEEGKKEVEERSGIDQPEQDLEKSFNEISNDDEPTKSIGMAVEKVEAPNVPVAEPDVKEDTEDELEERSEEDEGEAARRARISARLAKSGGFNPFAGGPPVRKPSESSLPERRTSVESPGSFKPTLHEEQELSVQPLARREADSVNDEAAEEDEPFDILKPAEGDS